MIRIDYEALRDENFHAADVGDELLREAQGFWGRRARRDILRLMDQFVRVQTVEVSQREVNPQLLYPPGQEALLEAIKTYRVGQPGSFKEFATVLVRQAMNREKARLSPPAH